MQTSPEKYEELRLKRELWLNLYQLSHVPLCKLFADRLQQRLMMITPALPVIPVPEFDGAHSAVMETMPQELDYQAYALMMDQLSPPDFIKEVEEQK